MRTYLSGRTRVDEVTCSDKNGVPFLVRGYSEADRAELQRFYESFEPKRVAQGLPPAEPPRIHGWLDTVLGSGIHLLALRGGELIGHALVMPTDRPGVGEYAVFLSAPHRGGGVGSELNRVAAATARAGGFTGLWLTVEPGNRAAVRSYEKVGFRFIVATTFTLEPEMELFL